MLSICETSKFCSYKYSIALSSMSLQRGLYDIYFSLKILRAKIVDLTKFSSWTYSGTACFVKYPSLKLFIMVSKILLNSSVLFSSLTVSIYLSGIGIFFFCMRKMFPFLNSLTSLVEKFPQLKIDQLKSFSLSSCKNSLSWSFYSMFALFKHLVNPFQANL